MTRKLTELNLFVWVSQKNARPRRFALVERSDQGTRVVPLSPRQLPTGRLPLHDDNDGRTDIEIPVTEILGRIFTSAPGGVAAPKILPRDFL